jgi:glutamyl-tRNA synthetase
MVDTARELGREADLEGLTANKSTVLAALPELQPRAKTVLELIDLAQFIYAVRPIAIESAAAEQFTDEARKLLGEAITLLDALPEWSATAMNDAMRTFAEARGLKLGKVAQPLRVALTGRTVSPGIFEVMVLIGKAESLGRIRDQAR